MTSVNLNDSTIAVFLDDPDGPVGQMLEEMSEHGAALARIFAPVRLDNVWNEETSSGALNAATAPGGKPKPPGYLKARIRGKHGVSRAGQLYGSVNAPADPAIFLEYPAVQLNGHKHPFLTTALWSITVP
jgi:hypothetical protein